MKSLGVTNGYALRGHSFINSTEPKSQVYENQWSGIYWSPIRGKKGLNFVNFKISSHELAIEILRYLTYSSLGHGL